jgi:flagellar L-ring protein precursor FlgH
MRAYTAVIAISALVLVAARPLHGQAPVSWTADAQQFRVGDMISVLLDEYTLASANRNETAEEERTRTLSAGASYDGTSLGSGGLQTGTGGRSQNRGQATRHDRLAGEITVRVMEVDSAGRLRIEGTKMLQIDGHEQELRLTGWVRPADVPPQNVIESWRVADASIVYEASGNLGKARQGLLTRIIGWIWP